MKRSPKLSPIFSAVSSAILLDTLSSGRSLRNDSLAEPCRVPQERSRGEARRPSRPRTGRPMKDAPAPTDGALPVVVYAAKSTADDRDSTRSQIEQTTAHVERLGGRFLVASPFSEEDVSGFRRDRGPELEAAMLAARQAAGEHRTAELWVFHSSRLARGDGSKAQGRSLLKVYADLLADGVSLRSVTDDEFLTNPLLVGVASVQNHKYSADLSAHVKRGVRAKFERGEMGGGPVPDGYVRVAQTGADGQPVTDRRGNTLKRTVIDPNRASVIERIRDLAWEGKGDASIARQLNR